MKLAGRCYVAASVVPREREIWRTLEFQFLRGSCGCLESADCEVNGDSVSGNDRLDVVAIREEIN